MAILVAAMILPAPAFPQEPPSIEERLRRLEEANDQLRRENVELRHQVSDLSRRYDGLARPVQATSLDNDPARDASGTGELGRPAGSLAEPGDTLRSETGRGPAEAPTAVNPGTTALGLGAGSVQRRRPPSSH